MLIHPESQWPNPGTIISRSQRVPDGILIGCRLLSKGGGLGPSTNALPSCPRGSFHDSHGRMECAGVFQGCPRGPLRVCCLLESGRVPRAKGEVFGNPNTVSPTGGPYSLLENQGHSVRWEHPSFTKICCHRVPYTEATAWA